MVLLFCVAHVLVVMGLIYLQRFCLFVPIPSLSSLVSLAALCVDMTRSQQLPLFAWVPISDHCLGKNLGLSILVLAPIIDVSFFDVELS